MSKELIASLRTFEIDHKPDGWPAIRMREISALLDALEEAERIIEAQRELYRNAVSVANKLEAAEEERDTWKARAEFSYQERGKLERKLEIAREALESFDGLFDYTGQAEKRRREALSQLGDKCEG